MSDDRPAAADGDAAEPGEVLSYLTPAAARVRWVSVWKPRNTMEANLAVGILQERGIRARVDMENAAELGLPYAGVAYSKVQVLAEDAEAARKLLLEIDQQRARRQEAMSLKCPNCGTPNPKRIMHPLRWAAWGMFAAFFICLPFERFIAELFPVGWLGLLLLGFLIALLWGATPRWRCKSCGHRWYAQEPEEIEEDEQDDDYGEVEEAGDDDDDDDDDDEKEDRVTPASSPPSQ
jgi:hypothetical protein